MSIMRTFIQIYNETGIYEQEVDGDKYFELCKNTKVTITELKPNTEFSRVYKDDCEAHLVLDCRATVNDTEEVNCHLVSSCYWEEGEEFDLEVTLEDEVNWIKTGEINLNDEHDKQGRSYKSQIIEKSSLLKQVCIGEPRLMKPTVKYFE